MKEIKPEGNHVYMPMVMAFSDCVGTPILKLQINSPMRTAWDTGAFVSAMLCGVIDEGNVKHPLRKEEDADRCMSLAIRFEVQCIKSGDSYPSKVAVELVLCDSYGKKSKLRINCSPAVFERIDLSRTGLSELSRDDDDDANDHVVHKHDQGDITLVDDLPHCRELVGRLCRELTSQLWQCGYFLRPVNVSCGQAN